MQADRWPGVQAVVAEMPMKKAVHVDSADMAALRCIEQHSVWQ